MPSGIRPDLPLAPQAGSKVKWQVMAAAAGVAALVLAKRRPKSNQGRVSFVTASRGPRVVGRYLVRLSARAGVPIEVTSWTRTPEAQARAMLAKVDRGENLADLYQNKAAIRALMDAPRNVASWADIIDAWTRSGQPLSRHLDGYGTDIRTRNLRPDQIARLIAAAATMGARPTLESDHLHIGWPRP